MKSLKHIPNRQGKVIPIKPTFILLKDACEYVGMKADLFREVSRKHGLSVYAYGTKKVWFKVSELDEMMESFLIIDNKKALSR